MIMVFFKLMCQHLQNTSRINHPLAKTSGWFKIINMKKQIKRRSDCPISFAMDTLGDKWSLLIIRDLMFNDKQYYGEFIKSAEKISTNILAERLQRLESEGIITKAHDEINFSKYKYSLTEKGLDLLPMLLDIATWSAKYDPNTGISKNFIQRIKLDKAGLQKEILEKLTSKQS